MKKYLDRKTGLQQSWIYRYSVFTLQKRCEWMAFFQNESVNEFARDRPVRFNQAQLF